MGRPSTNTGEASWLLLLFTFSTQPWRSSVVKKFRQYSFDPGTSHLIGVSTTGNWTYSTPNLVVLRTTTFTVTVYFQYSTLANLRSYPVCTVQYYTQVVFFPYSMQYHGTNVGNFMKYSTRYLVVVLIMPQYCSSSHGIFYSSICQATCSQQIQ